MMERTRLEKYYLDQGKAELKKKHSYSNVMEIPSLKKIVINISTKEAVKDSKIMKNAINDLMVLTGQKPIVTKAKKINCGIQA